jgi:hypothetical protein
MRLPECDQIDAILREMLIVSKEMQAMNDEFASSDQPVYNSVARDLLLNQIKELESVVKTILPSTPFNEGGILYPHR